MHHHFPTKATMTAAVARRYGDQFLAAVARRPNEEPKTPSPLTDRRSERLSIEDGRTCLCGVLGAEAGVPSPEVADGIVSLFVGALMIYRSGSAAPERKRESFM